MAKKKMIHNMCRDCVKKCKSVWNIKDTMVGCTGFSVIPKKAKAIKRVRIMCWAYIGSASGKVCVSSVKPYPPSEQCYIYVTESKLKRLNEKYLGGKK